MKARTAVAAARLEQLGRQLDLTSAAEVWLGLSVMSGRLPLDDLVLDTRRRIELEGPDALVAAALDLATPTSLGRPVLVAEDRTLVDPGPAPSSAHDDEARVARELLRHWTTEHDPMPVRWSAEHDALHPADDDDAVVVPASGRFVGLHSGVPDEALPRLQAMVRHAPLHAGFLGAGCGAVTSSEDAAPGRPASFAQWLAAVAHADEVVTLSESAATEFRGWVRMLGGAGLTGPRTTSLALPRRALADADRDGIASLAVAGLPLVLAAGTGRSVTVSAAAALWHEGHRFALVVLGGGREPGLSDEIVRLRRLGRPVVVAGDLSVAELHRLYRDARFAVVVPVHDGLGLVAAELLSLATPVVASSYGAVAEVVRSGGAVSVDPRDDAAVTDAFRRLLTDDVLLGELGAPSSDADGWEVCAEQAWEVLVGDQSRSADTAAS